jgi:uncharacterized membrane protein
MNIFKILLYLHIICGGLSLIVGLVVMILKKGDKNHKQIGSVFFYSMLTAALVSIPMSFLHPNYFLFIVGVWTTYMLITGKRYLSIKQIADVKKIDWVITIVMSLFGAVLSAIGVYLLIKGGSFGLVLFAFGGIAMLMTYSDYNAYSGKSKYKNFNITNHIQRMVGSYIASVTAFLVVNNHHVFPDVLAWLLPGTILAPLIAKWSKEWGKKK